jgi:hypothetical protein
MAYAHQVAPGRAQMVRQAVRQAHGPEPSRRANTNDRNSKFKTDKILSIAVWDFSALSGKVNRFYLNQLDLTLTFPWY